MSFRAIGRAGSIALLVAAVVAPGGCKPPRTQLLVWIDTDVPECRLPEFRLRCGYNWDGHGDPTAVTCDYPLRRGISMAEVMLPGSIGVTGDDTRPTDPFTLEVDDNTQPDPTVIPPLRRIATLQFLSNQTARLTLFLNSACLAVAPASATHPCPARAGSCTLSQSCEMRGQGSGVATTCGNDGLCRPVAVASTELAIGADGGAMDAGPRDAVGSEACH